MSQKDDRKKESKRWFSEDQDEVLDYMKSLSDRRARLKTHREMSKLSIDQRKAIFNEALGSQQRQPSPSSSTERRPRGLAALRQRGNQATRNNGGSLDQVAPRDQNSSPRPIQRSTHIRSSSRGQQQSGNKSEYAMPPAKPEKREKAYVPSKPSRGEHAARSRESELRKIASKSGHVASGHVASTSANGDATDGNQNKLFSKLIQQKSASKQAKKEGSSMSKIYAGNNVPTDINPGKEFKQAATKIHKEEIKSTNGLTEYKLSKEENRKVLEEKGRRLREQSKEIEKKKKSLQIAQEEVRKSKMSDPVPAKRAENPVPARRVVANQEEICSDKQPIRSKNEVSFASMPQQVVNKNLANAGGVKREPSRAYVGFASLPNQVHRKSVKKGFEFTLMVAGESGLGKSTLVNSLFLTNMYQDRQLPDIEECMESTCEIEVRSEDIEERGVKLRLNIVDTPGFGRALDSTKCYTPIVEYISEQMDAYLKEERGFNRRHITDTRVHACFYFISASSRGLKPLDVAFMQAVHDKVNIVPVIGKADMLTKPELMRLKSRVMDDVIKNGISIYNLPDADDDEDEAFKEQTNLLKKQVPFAVVGSTTLVANKEGRKVRAREYPWGIIEVEDAKHSDFIHLRTMLVTHMQDLQEVTHDILYERYRAEKLQCEGSNPDLNAPVDTASALEAKELEIQRMQQQLEAMKKLVIQHNKN